MRENVCKYCHRPITQSVLAEKRRRKVANAINSARKAKENGNHRGGRNKIRNDDQIKKLRRDGLSIRAIAREIGLSTTAVQRGLKS